MGEPRGVRPGELTAAEIADALWLGSGPDRETTPSDRPPTRPGSEAAVADDRPVPSAGIDTTATDGSPPSPVPRSSEMVPGRPGLQAAVSQRPLAQGVLPPAHSALPETLLLERALRPLRSRTSLRHQVLLDEEATAQRAAEDELWLPLLRTAPSRPWAEAVVITDDSPSMGMWRQTTREFSRVLSHLDVFDAVRTVQLVTGQEEQNGARATVPVPGLRTRAGVLSAASLNHPAGRRLLLVVTDGLAPAWRTGAVGPLLHRFARTQTVAVVLLLPESLWRISGIATDRVGLTDRAGRPGNRGLRWTKPARRQDDGPPNRWRDGEPETSDRIPVPVLELSAGGLGSWAQFLGGRSGPTPVPLRVMWAAPQPAQASSPPAGELADEPSPTAEERVRQAQTTLSPVAMRLAVALAAVPLHLPTIQFLQQRQFPDSRPHHLSELVASGLLRHVPVRDSSAADFPFDFRPGVREELLSLTKRADTVRTFRVALQAAPPSAWTAGQRYLQAVLDGQDPAPPEATSDDRESIEQAVTVLRALSGPYLVSAQRTQAALSTDSAPTAVLQSPTAVAAHPGDTVCAAEDREESAADPVTGPFSPSAARPPSVWGAVPPRNINFTGREDQLAVLRERLGHGDMGTVEAVTGMGAVGKSQLAIEYIYRHAAEFDVVWWIPSDTPSTITAALHGLAEALRLPPPSGAGPNAVVPQVLEALRVGDAARRWLLVYDNAESTAEVRPFLPRGGPGSVLITTRNPQWAHVARPLDLDVLSRQEATALLRRRNPHLDAAEADQLAEALGDLPLALEQASGWLHMTGMRASEYLRLLEERRSELLDLSPPHDYELSVTAAWRLALARMAEEDASALQMLRVLAWLAPEPVPLELFAQHGRDHGTALGGLPGDPLHLARALRTLNRYSLVRIDHHAHAVQMHRLVSMCVRSDMNPGESAQACDASRLLLAGLPPGTGLTRHLLSCRAAESSDRSVRAAILRQVRWLAGHAAVDDAQSLARAAYEAWTTRTDEEVESERAELSGYLPSGESA